MTGWRFDPEMDHEDDDAPIVLGRETTILDEVDEMPESCEGLKIGCEMSSLLASESAKSLINSGRIHDIVSGEAASSAQYMNAAMKAHVNKQISELGAVESKATETILKTS